MLFKMMFFMYAVFMFRPGDIFGQPPAGKYDTTSYPEDRKAIAMLGKVNDSSRFLNDDYIATGPEGRVSYGYEEWKKGFKEEGARFKSVRPVPGSAILRIYNGDAAVKNITLDVVFATTKGDFAIKVARTETYIKHDGRWYFVSGQGTRVLTREEYDDHMRPPTN